MNTDISSTKVSVGFVGCGRVAQHYAKILLSLDPVESFNVVAVCDLDEHKAKMLANQFSCESFDCCEAMFARAKLDLVVIMVPSGAHYEVAEAALICGLNVLVEKPLTLKLEDAEQLRALSIQKNLVCATVFQNRYNPAVQVLKQAFDKGSFGTIVTVAVRLRWCREQDYYNDGWHGTWAMDGGVASQQAIHHIDALNWILGPVNSVVASATARVNVLEAEDTMVALLQLSNGALGTLELTTGARPRDFEASLSIVGDKGFAEIGGVALNQVKEWSFIEDPGLGESIPSRFSEDVDTGYGLGHGRLLRDVSQKLLAGSSEVPVTLEQSMSTLKLLHSLYASVEKSSWINVGDGIGSNTLGR